MTNQKGFDLSINAVSESREYIENYYILGEGPKREFLENLILKLKLSEIIKLKGFCDPEIYLDKCDLGLIPSKWEGFGLVSVEMVSFWNASFNIRCKRNVRFILQYRISKDY